MKLFNELMRCAEQFPASFTPLLMRLSLMEGLAAIKLLHARAVYDPEREALILETIHHKGQGYGWSQCTIARIQAFFKKNMLIAKLIQEAFIKEHAHSSQTELCDYALRTIGKITEKKVNKDTLLVFTRIVIDELTDTILQSIPFLSDDEAYDRLQQCIENSYILIQKTSLTEAVQGLKYDSRTLAAVVGESHAVTSVRRSNRAEFYSGFV
ncbi:MAG: chorismate mutase [Legionellaceae bacterium]|nr:chorismate mutase [Legionellaceae bacterium]